LGAQPETDYNAGGPVIPYVLPRSDGPWLLYAGTVGRPRNDLLVPNFNWWTGLALSEDAGLTWRWHTTQPLIPGRRPYDRAGTGTVCVLRESAGYRMWYTACRGIVHDGERSRAWVGLGYAESADGIAWHEPRGEWLIAPRQNAVQPFEWWIAKPEIVVTEHDGRRTYRLWVSAAGRNYRIRSLTSPDGLNWSWEPEDRSHPEGDVGAAGEFDDTQRSYNTVIREGDRYHQWFNGNGYGASGVGYATAPAEAGPEEKTAP